MAQGSKTNLPNAALRWNVEIASKEFDVHSETLRKLLIQNDQLPGEDGCYSTPQITVAMYGSMPAERLRKLKEDADKVALDNAITRGEYLHRGELSRGLAGLADGMLSVINSSSGLSREEKEDFLLNISRWPVVFREVSVGQSAYRNGNGNGEHSQPKSKPGPKPKKKN
jgi:hypothetical protein